MQYLSAILILGACSIAAGAQTLGDYPPRFAHERAGRFEITAANVYLCSSLQSGELSSALLQLDQALFAGEARRAPRSLPAGGGVLVGLQNESPLLRGLLNRCKKDLPKSGLGQEGFLIDVAPNRILITAAHPAGLYYGIRRVTALAAGGINCGTYADWPAMRWRGLHVLVSGRASIPAIEELLTSYMPQRRLNELILEVGYNYQFKSHPEIAAPDGLTFDDCRRLAAVAAANYIRIVPEIDCLGHQSWAKTTFALLRTHPEFDETPDAPVDNSTLYCRSWCPSDPDVYRVVDDLADELIDAFHADAFHVGMDEVFLLGKCPRCKGKDSADLFAHAVNELHKHLVGKRKVQMMMWADRLEDGAATGYGEWEASENGTAPAVDKIPRDIILCDWHYDNRTDFPSIKMLTDKGFQVQPSGWNKLDNVGEFIRCGLEQAGPRLYGYLATTWSSPEQVIREGVLPAGNSAKERSENDLHAAIDLGAKLAWQGDASDLPSTSGAPSP